MRLGRQGEGGDEAEAEAARDAVEKGKATRDAVEREVVVVVKRG